MPSKRKFSITSTARYNLKAYRVHKIDGVPPELAMSIANAQTSYWTLRFGMFHTMWVNRVEPLLAFNGVPRELWGLYRAFLNQLLSKAMGTGKQEIELVIARWRNILDENIMLQIVEAITEGRQVPRQAVAQTGGQPQG